MSDRPSRALTFLRELKRRKIYRVAATYGAVGLVLIEASDHIFNALLFPAWAHRLFVVLIIFGFPVALLLAWAFEVTPDGVRRTALPREDAAGVGADAGYVEARDVEARDDGRAPGILARHARTLAFGVAAGLVTVVAIGLWTAGDDPDSPPAGKASVAELEEDAPGRAAAADSAGPAQTAAASEDRTGAAGEEAGGTGEPRSTRERDVATGESGAPATSSSGESEASVASGATSGAGDDPSGSAAAGATSADGGRAAAATTGEASGADAGSRARRDVAVFIDGDAFPGHLEVESALLERLASGGLDVLDRTSLELRSVTPEDARSAPETVGRRIGARVLVIGGFRSDAAPSVGGFYTGTATLSLRTYDGSSGRLLGSKTFRVGGSDSPGKLGNTAAAAAGQAAEQLGHQAARALARDLEQVLSGGEQERR